MSSANGPWRVMLPSSPGTRAVLPLRGDSGPQPAPVLCCCWGGREHLGSHRLAPSGDRWANGLSGCSRRVWSRRFSQQRCPYAPKRGGVCESCVTKGGKYMGENDNLFVSQQDTGLCWPLLWPTRAILLLFMEKNTPDVERDTQPCWYSEASTEILLYLYVYYYNTYNTIIVLYKIINVIIYNTNI